MVNRKRQQTAAKSSKDGQNTSLPAEGKKKRTVKTQPPKVKLTVETRASTSKIIADERNVTGESNSLKVDKGKDETEPIRGSNKRPREVESEGIVLQSSGRISKRPKKDYDPYSPPRKPTPAPKKQAKTPEPRKGINKGRRSWEIWTVDDKKHFFEALKEHGRDWKALYEFVKKHNKNKNVPEVTRERIRQFYYRIWHKISKYLTCPEGVDKQALETFGLICYGEMRKRIGSYDKFRHMDADIGEKLNEMVHKGATFVKWKEKKSRKIKNFRLKTPRCTVLQKLNNLEGQKLPKMRTNPLRLPTEVVVELRPKNNAAWTNIQAMAQNPRLRTKVDPAKRLSSIIDFLNKKWKSHRLKTKEHMNEKEKPMQELKLHPPPKAKLSSWELLRFNHLKINTSQSQELLGLQTYMENLKNFNDCSPTARKINKRTVSRKQATNTDKDQVKASSKITNSANKDSFDILKDLKSNSETGASKNTLSCDEMNELSKEKGINDVGIVDVGYVFNKTGTLNKKDAISSTDNSDVNKGSIDYNQIVYKHEHESQNQLLIRPFGGLSTDSEGCSSNHSEKPFSPLPTFLPSFASPPSKYDSSHGADSVISDGKNNVSIRSDLSSSPETKLSNTNKENECTTKSLESETGIATYSVGSSGTGICSTGNQNNDNKDMVAEGTSCETACDLNSNNKPVVSCVVTEKLEALKEGVVRSKAEMLTIADIFLMMGSPQKIVLEYEWVEMVVTPDFLDMGHVTNMLRRLIHLATSEFSDFTKPKLPAQRFEVKDDATSACSKCSSCGGSGINSLSSNSTPPPNTASRGRGGSRAGGGRGGSKSGTDPRTPRSSRRENVVGSFRSPQGSATSSRVVTFGGVKVIKTGEDLASDIIFTLSPPSGSNISDSNSDSNSSTFEDKRSVFSEAGSSTRTGFVLGSLPMGSITEQELIHGTFKIPSTVAPRSMGGDGDSSPITVHNIAQKLSPKALMGYINRANSHTSQPLFLPPARRRRGIPRMRKPLTGSHIKIAPKPLIISAPYVVNNMSQLINSQNSGQIPQGNVKVMHPADVKGLTIKNLIPGGKAVASVCVPHGVTVRMPNPSSLMPGKPTIQVASTIANLSTASIITTLSKSMPTSSYIKSSQPQVPLESITDGAQHNIFNDGSGQAQATSLDRLYNELMSSQQQQQPVTTKSVSSLISSSLIGQAAMATGISMDFSNGANSNSSLIGGLPVLKLGFMSDGNNSNLSSLLDISIPGTSTGDTDKLIDLALANSSSAFSVSGLLDTSLSDRSESNKYASTSSPGAATSSNAADNKDPTLSSTRPMSPGQLSPNKVYKPSIGCIDEDCFNLSNFLPDSPLKKTTMSTPKSHDHNSSLNANTTVLSSGPSLLNESSRDSVRFDMESALQSMLNENSLDYATKFAELAEEINLSTHEDKHMVRFNSKS